MEEHKKCIYYKKCKMYNKTYVVCNLTGGIAGNRTALCLKMFDRINKK